MSVTRPQAKAFVFQFLADDLRLSPPPPFQEDDDLSDYLYDGHALVRLGTKLNNRHWNGVRVTPMEMRALTTIKSLVDLVYVKARAASGGAAKKKKSKSKSASKAKSKSVAKSKSKSKAKSKAKSSG